MGVGAGDDVGGHEPVLGGHGVGGGVVRAPLEEIDAGGDVAELGQGFLGNGGEIGKDLGGACGEGFFEDRNPFGGVGAVFGHGGDALFQLFQSGCFAHVTCPSKNKVSVDKSRGREGMQEKPSENRVQTNAGQGVPCKGRPPRQAGGLSPSGLHSFAGKPDLSQPALAAAAFSAARRISSMVARMSAAL